MKKPPLFPVLFLTAALTLNGCSPQAQHPPTAGSTAETSAKTAAGSAAETASGSSLEIAGALDGMKNSRSEDQSYYSNFESKQAGQNYVLSGAYYQNKSVKGLVNAEVLRETDLSVTGTLKCTKGNIRLIFQAPDGTETVLAECENGEDSEETAVALTVTAPAGKSVFYFSGTNSVCDFNLEFSMPDHVSYYLSTGNLAGL